MLRLKLGGAGIGLRLSCSHHDDVIANANCHSQLRRQTLQVSVLQSELPMILNLFPLYHCLQQCIDLVQVYRHDVWLHEHSTELV